MSFVRIAQSALPNSAEMSDSELAALALFPGWQGLKWPPAFYTGIICVPITVGLTDASGPNDTDQSNSKNDFPRSQYRRRKSVEEFL